MPKPTTIPDMGKLNLEDDDPDDLFASPSSGATTQKHTPQTASTSKTSTQKAQQPDPSQREARLRAELERVRQINSTITGITDSLQKAKANMSTVHQTVNNASTLLATWTRILSQTEHNQRLILNPGWQGASQDVEDEQMEEERKVREGERRVREEESRRAEAEKRREDEERRRAVEGASKTGTRGRGRGTRAGSAAGRYGISGTARGRGTPGPAARGSSIGRGAAAGTRGRGRGLG